MSKPGEDNHHIIVIGASAGGVEAMADLVSGLSADLPAAVFIVQHIPSFSRSNLDLVLQNYTKLRVKKAEDGETVRKGVIYVAVADKHLLLEPGRVLVRKGPRENRFRPAVDTLFRSAAHAYRDRVIGVVLSGTLNDGTSEMWTIKRLGGRAIVQDPEEAMFPDMPASVMEYSEVDHCLPAREIGTLINTLSREQVEQAGRTKKGLRDEELLQIEIDIAKGKNGLTMGILEKGTRSALACPECHGALTRFKEGKLIRFRCHTGHAHTAETLLASVRENVEKSMWEVMRGMEESHLLLAELARQMERTEQYGVASMYRERLRDIQQRAIKIQEVIQAESLVEPVVNAGGVKSFQ
jgi:two-component system chemotaxis response regulator CheB